MQTFLPLPSYVASAKVLDNKRLGKQRVECKQILRALGVRVGSPHIIGGGWRNHPAVRMWRRFEDSLCCYAMAMCHEWIDRGFADSLLPQFEQAAAEVRQALYVRPPFLGNDAFHASHRSNLLRKDPVFYGQYGWAEPADLPYVWPAAKEEVHAVS